VVELLPTRVASAGCGDARVERQEQGAVCRKALQPLPLALEVKMADVLPEWEGEDDIDVDESPPETEKNGQVKTDLESWGNVLVAYRRPLFDFLVPCKGTKGRREGDRTLTLWFAKDHWKACLRAKDGSCVAFVTGETLGDLFFNLHQGLEKETLKWKEERSDRKRGR